MNVTAVAAHASGTASDTTTDSTKSGIDKLANEQTFLRLFVAQLKNQDPLNPQDGTQFVTQLATFSQLEQALQMRQDLDTIVASLENNSAADAS